MDIDFEKAFYVLATVTVFAAIADAFLDELRAALDELRPEIEASPETWDDKALAVADKVLSVADRALSLVHVVVRAFNAIKAPAEKAKK